MPTRNAQGILVAAVQTGIPPKKLAKQVDPKQRAMVMAICVSLLMLLFFAMGATVWYVLPSIKKQLSVASQRRDLDNMRNIVQALNDYGARYGTYPSPSVVDATGKKLYSWRVLILPFLGYEDLYSRFQLDQAWDSPANMALLNQMPRVYASPNAASAFENHEPNYSLLIGPGTVFPPSGPMAKSQVTDSPTLLLVETKEGGTVWTEPVDIDVGIHGVKVGNAPMKTIGGLHDDGVVLMDCDGKGLRVPRDVPKLILDALVTPTGGENVETDSFQE
jgi:hypothetical protein